jgi:hypothetical protein
MVQSDGKVTVQGFRNFSPHEPQAQFLNTEC